MPNIKGTDSPILCTLGTTSYSIFFGCCSQAVTTLQNNVLTPPLDYISHTALALGLSHTINSKIMINYPDICFITYF